MKSWISFLLPNDEYREKKILYFLSEGAIILLLFIIGGFITNRYFLDFQIDLDLFLIISVFIFLAYVFIRYLISGMEYTDVVSKQTYKKELKAILTKSFGFVVIFSLFYTIIQGFPRNINEWIEILGISLIAGIILFLFNYISLKKSYKNNRDLL